MSALKSIIFFALLVLITMGFSRPNSATNYNAYFVADSLDGDTVNLLLPHDTDQPGPSESGTSGISLPLPNNITSQVVYDPITNTYKLQQTIGDRIDYRRPTSMSLEDYLRDDINKNVSEFWTKKQEEEAENNSAFAPKLSVGGKGFENIFGSNEIEIRPQGTAELTFGINISKTENPRIPERQRRISTFDFDQRIQLNVVGNIGTKMKLTTNYNTQATFEFENQMKLEYTGDEDEIIKKIEAGNVSLPLQGTLISGSQSLFGVKLETQFGKLRNTTVLTQQKGERKEINVEGGAQTQIFDIRADAYEANRHYFLSSYFRDSYDAAFNSLPNVNSGANVTRIEVWVVNQQANTQDVRNVIGVTDLGENQEFISKDLGDAVINQIGMGGDPRRYPDNEQNSLYQTLTSNQTILDFTSATQAIGNLNLGLVQGLHFERVGNARKLTPSEFTYNAALGFISLRQALNNAEVLCVAYEYTQGGEVFQVGTLSQDGIAAPQALVLKMLKSSITSVQSPMWDLMMKNVYNLGTFQINRENFRFDVWYNNPASGIDMNFIPREPLDDTLLLQLLNLDKLDINNRSQPDGVFDFVDNAATQGGTINAQNGRVYFPVVEPFGSHLASEIRDAFGPGNEAQAEQLVQQTVFQALYDSTKIVAQQIPSLNRFRLKGQYQSASSSEIPLNALNIPQGSVSVTAGGVKLIENKDYTVDYNIGRVRIINEGLLDSGTPIKVSLESNSLFSIQTKTMIGSRFDYTLSDNMSVGATFLNLRERPLTQKVNIGDEPVNNTVLGADFKYQKEAPWLTRIVDRIPFIDTKAESSIDAQAEAAYLIPGHSRAIGKDGNAYLDDFEGSQSTIDIRNSLQWFLASTPKGQDQFPEAGLEDSLIVNYNRALLSWYTIDPSVFFRQNSLTPNSITEEVQSDHRMREVLESEVFPERNLAAGTPPNITTLDMTYYPDERGPYNYELPNGTNESSGLNPDGTLVDPETRWAGIQRALTTTDFEAANIEFIQFWVMDPFNEDSEATGGGDLYFNLGNVSEDLLNDSQMSFENGFPSENQSNEVIQGTWGNYPDPSTFNVVSAFDNSTGNYLAQDIGVDGLNNVAEQSFFTTYLDLLTGFLNPDALQEYREDPSKDNYSYFRGSAADNAELNTLERYKKYNGYEGNSNTSSPEGFPIAATNIPNTEDINQDLTLGTIESYYQYKVSMRPGDLGTQNVGKNYITDVLETSKTTIDGQERQIKWYQFRIPVKEFTSRHGQIADFRSIRFIRMYMKEWSNEVTLRFARLELVRGEWRKYVESLEAPGEENPNDDAETTFNIAAVNIEENGKRKPIKYVVPPGIVRERDIGTANLRDLNEQSLALSVCNLRDGDARAAFRNINFDMRRYGRIEMYLHAEAAGVEGDLDSKDLTAFIRLGTDFDQNYYEYEIPLELTPWGASSESEIWPEANNMDIELKKFQSLKSSRPDSYSILQPFSEYDGTARITVKGNPNLSNVVTVMIGIRNPKSTDNPFAADDQLAKCAVVWANELRLTDFNESGGWAAVGRLNANLADFATFSLAGNISKPGWGTLEQRVQERQQETIMGIDASSTVQLGKFFGEESGVTLPMYVGFSEQFENPQYDPLAPDIEFDDLDLTRENRKSRLKRSQTFTKRRSINFTNIKFDPKGKKKGGKGKDDKKGKDPSGKSGKTPGKGGGKGGSNKKFYDVSNFSFSYGYNEVFMRDVNTEFDFTKNYNGAVDYSFSNRPKEIKPFSKIGFIKNTKALKFIKDFNFYPGIKSFSIRNQMDRMYRTSRVRNNTELLFGVEADVLINTQVMKTWNWNRQYNLKYDITKSLKFDFSANNLALVDEPAGLIDKTDEQQYQDYKNEVINEIKGFGLTTNYNHNARLTYKLPLDKFPLVNFVSSDVSYQASYQWDRAPLSQDTLGNTIQNSRNINVNAQANMKKLYDKWPYLKNLNKPKSKKNNKKTSNQDKDGFGEDDKDKKEKKDPINPVDEIAKFLMMVKNVSGSYTKNEGLLLPGYGKETNLLGMDGQFEGPGWGFIFGQQNTDLFGNPTDTIALKAAENGWLVNAPNLNNQYNTTFSESFNFRANLEPIKYFKIEINATKSETRGYNSFFRFVEESGDYEFQTPQETGNFSQSVNTWATAFIDDDADFNNDVFQQFLDNRTEVSGRLNDATYQEDVLPNGYHNGWGPTQQDVIIPAFLAAYTGQDANAVSLDVGKLKVAPNWRVTYDGLSKLEGVKKYFKTFSISHAFRSTMTASYVSNLNYTEDSAGRPTALDQNESPNYISDRQINSVSISESLSPLIGFDMTIKTRNGNDPQVKIELKRDRTINLGLSNYQVTENKSKSLVVGLGYKLPEVPNPFKRRAKGSKLSVQMLENSPLTMRADLTIRDNLTVIRKVVENQNQVTAGQKLISIKASADLSVSNKLTVRFFYEQQLNRPKISTTFPTSNINSGLALRFTLSS